MTKADIYKKSQSFIEEQDGKSQEKQRGHRKGAWVVLFGCTVISVFTGIDMILFGSYYELLSAYFGYGKGYLSWVIPLKRVLLVFLALVISPMLDGPHFRRVLLGSSFALVIGFFVTSFATHGWHIFIGLGLMPAFSRFVDYGVEIAIHHHFNGPMRLMALNVSYMGTNIGEIIAPMMIYWLNGLYGWKWSMRMIAIAFTNATVLSCLLHRPNDKGGFDEQYNGSEIRSTEENINRCQHFKKSISLLKNDIFLLAILAEIAFTVTRIFALVHTNARLLSYGIDDKWAYFLVTVIGLSSFASRLISLPVNAKFDLDPCVFVIVLRSLCGMTQIVSIISWNLGYQAALQILYGFCSGSQTAYESSMYYHLFGLDQLGRVYGLMLITNFIAFFSASTVSAYLYDITGAYTVPLILSGLCGILSSFIVFIMMLRLRKVADTPV